jgi:hypothetical protein
MWGGKRWLCCPLIVTDTVVPSKWEEYSKNKQAAIQCLATLPNIK